MKLSNFGILHIGFILLAIGICVSLFFILRNKSDKTKKIVIFSLLCLNLLTHFIAPLILESEPSERLRRIFWLNTCGITAVTAPFIFWSKDRFLKGGMVYVGLFTGLLAMFLPSEFVGQSLSLDMVRFMYQHAIIWIVPVLMISLKMYEVKWKEIWIMPVYFFLCLFIVLANTVIAYEIGTIGHISNQNMEWKPFPEMQVLFDCLNNTIRNKESLLQSSLELLAQGNS